MLACISNTKITTSRVHQHTKQTANCAGKHPLLISCRTNRWISVIFSACKGIYHLVTGNLTMRRKVFHTKMNDRNLLSTKVPSKCDPFGHLYCPFPWKQLLTNSPSYIAPLANCTRPLPFIWSLSQSPAYSVPSEDKWTPNPDRNMLPPGNWRYSPSKQS